MNLVNFVSICRADFFFFFSNRSCKIINHQAQRSTVVNEVCWYFDAVITNAEH